MTMIAWVAAVKSCCQLRGGKDLLCFLKKKKKELGPLFLNPPLPPIVSSGGKGNHRHWIGVLALGSHLPFLLCSLYLTPPEAFLSLSLFAALLQPFTTANGWTFSPSMVLLCSWFCYSLSGRMGMGVAAGSFPKRSLVTSNHLWHLESMTQPLFDTGKILHLNAVFHGESLSFEENDHVFPSPEFSSQALTSSLNMCADSSPYLIFILLFPSLFVLPLLISVWWEFLDLFLTWFDHPLFWFVLDMVQVLFVLLLPFFWWEFFDICSFFPLRFNLSVRLRMTYSIMVSWFYRIRLNRVKVFWSFEVWTNGVGWLVSWRTTLEQFGNLKGVFENF